MPRINSEQTHFAGTTPGRSWAGALSRALVPPNLVTASPSPHQQHAPAILPICTHSPKDEDDSQQLGPRVHPFDARAPIKPQSLTHPLQ